MDMEELLKEPEDLSEREAKTRDRIIAYARQHFFERGFRKVTVEELCAGMAVSKRTFYKYFKNRDELVMAVMAENIKEIGPPMLENLSSDGPVPEIIENHFQLVTNAAFNMISAQMMSDVQTLMPEMWTMIEEFRAGILKVVFEAIKRGQREGAIRDDFNADELAKIMTGIVNAVANPNFIVSSGLGIDQVIKTLGIVLLRGIVAPGYKEDTDGTGPEK